MHSVWIPLVFVCSFFIMRSNLHIMKCTNLKCLIWQIWKYTYTCVTKTLSRISTLPSSWHVLSQSIPAPTFRRQPIFGIFFHHRLEWPILEFHINGFIQFVLFCVFFHSTKWFWNSAMLLHISVICVFFIADLYSIVWIYHNLFIHFPTDGHLGC